MKINKIDSNKEVKEEIKEGYSVNLSSLSIYFWWYCVYNHKKKYIYIYIYMHADAVKLLSGPSLAIFGCYYLGQVGVIIWAKLFLAYKIVVSSDFWHTQLSFCFYCLPKLSGKFLKIAFFKKRVQNLGFSIFCVLI